MDSRAAYVSTGELSPELERGRQAVADRSWGEAHADLAAADAAAPLAASDLELLATAAYMLGRDEEYLALLERAHQAHLADEEPLRAARDCFWMGMHLSLRGELGRGAAGSAGRSGSSTGTRRTAWSAASCSCRSRSGPRRRATGRAPPSWPGRRPRSRSGTATATCSRWRCTCRATSSSTTGRSRRASRSSTRRWSPSRAARSRPIPSGIVYCGAIIGCKHAYDPRRAQEWTEALTRWCEGQRDLVAFSGRCLAHRAEIMFLQGAWPEALDEARRAIDRAGRAHNLGAVGEAWCLVGDVHRLCGRPDAAAAAYGEARRVGCEPQPGLALLRLAQGDPEAAGAAIRRTLGETDDIPQRTRLLPACTEIMLACGDVEAAGAACDELERVAAGHGSQVLGALVAQARGAVHLAAGDPTAALPALRRAWRVWQEVGAPYDAARVRALIGQACDALGDHDAATLELREARETLARLGAHGGEGHGLSARELEVLRLVATGATTKAIAAELVLSERTVDRHLSNIYAKLGVGTRTAAAAYAFEHGLVRG